MQKIKVNLHFYCRFESFSLLGRSVTQVILYVRNIIISEEICYFMYLSLILLHMMNLI